MTTYHIQNENNHCGSSKILGFKFHIVDPPFNFHRRASKKKHFVFSKSIQDSKEDHQIRQPKPFEKLLNLTSTCTWPKPKRQQQIRMYVVSRTTAQPAFGKIALRFFKVFVQTQQQIVVQLHVRLKGGGVYGIFVI